MAEFGLCLDYSTNLTDYGHMIPLLLVPIIAFVVFATIALKPNPAFRGNGQAYNSDSLVLQGASRYAVDVPDPIVRLVEQIHRFWPTRLRKHAAVC